MFMFTGVETSVPCHHTLFHLQGSWHWIFQGHQIITQCKYLCNLLIFFLDLTQDPPMQQLDLGRKWTKHFQNWILGLLLLLNWSSDQIANSIFTIKSIYYLDTYTINSQYTNTCMSFFLHTQQQILIVTPQHYYPIIIIIDINVYINRPLNVTFDIFCHFGVISLELGNKFWKEYKISRGCRSRNSAWGVGFDLRANEGTS